MSGQRSGDNAFTPLHTVMGRSFGSAPLKHVMTILAAHADESWSCYPGQELIAAETDLGERTVRRALAGLEKQGLLIREARFNRGGRTSDRYYLQREAIEALPDAVPARLATTEEPAILTAVPAAETEVAATQANPTGRSGRGTTSGTPRKRPEKRSTADKPVFDGRNLYRYWAALIGFPQCTSGQTHYIDKMVGWAEGDYQKVASAMGSVENPRRPGSLGEAGDIVRIMVGLPVTAAA